ncbi:MAG TPA: PKD domain-containing protein [Saprospiraceae bacterium]|nr:PKD domain-containing protein [Saprospiraceae bacterium]
MKKIFFILIFAAILMQLKAQQADVTVGCSPLSVNFTAPDTLSEYFWELGTGNSSLQNPTALYVNTGIVVVRLFEGEGGPQIGENIIIHVINKPDVMIIADPISGCAPLNVKFTDASVFHDSLSVTGWNWTFGDGAAGNMSEITHLYGAEGSYNISLNLMTDRPGCDITHTFEDYVKVGPKSKITGFAIPDNVDFCTLPVSFPLNIIGEDDSSYTYLWDFGNGQSATGKNPNNPVYDSSGTYTIKLEVKTALGCSNFFNKTIYIGYPELNLEVQDTTCVQTNLLIENQSTGTIHSWNFGPNANHQTSTSKNPNNINFETGGVQTVTYETQFGNGCKVDTTFNVLVEDPTIDLTVDPKYGCMDSQKFTFTASSPDFKIYKWNGITTSEPTYEYDFKDADRDSFYRNELVPLKMTLVVETEYGCTAQSSVSYFYQKPDAHFQVSQSRGCAPLKVKFTDKSAGYYDISTFEYNWDDGTSSTYTVADTSMIEHIFTEPGEYFVKSLVTDENGCEDYSAGVWIYVGEAIAVPLTLPQTEVCYGDTLSFIAPDFDDRIDSWHFNIDGTVSQCAENKDYTHVFNDKPGLIDVNLQVEYNGCYSYSSPGTILVKGAKASFAYMTNCESPLTVMYRDSSINAESLVWIIGNDTLYNQDSLFNYEFPDRGDYKIKLVASNETDGCPENVDSLITYVRIPVADFDLDTLLCVGQEILLDASNSQDADVRCYEGYLWNLPNERPRESDSPTRPFVVPSREPDSIRLIVEDINGCTDTLVKKYRAIQINANFSFDADDICLPRTINFTDLSASDTTIVDWEWDFGSDKQNPSKLFTDSNGNIPVTLRVEDEHGCVDYHSDIIKIYKPTSGIFLQNEINCEGDNVIFNAANCSTCKYDEVTYEWHVSDGTTSQDKLFQKQMDIPGTYAVSLMITEDSTGCTNSYTDSLRIIKLPDAVISDFDSLFCLDSQMSFNGSNSFTDPNDPLKYFYDWRINGNIISSSENMAYSFNKLGKYEIQLGITNSIGCADTTSVSVRTYSPSGDFFTDDLTDICDGDSITFTIKNIVDATQLKWSNGQGLEGSEMITGNEISFIVEVKKVSIEADSAEVTITLSDDLGCTSESIIPVRVFKVVAEFDSNPADECPNLIEFINMSKEATNYVWNFGDGTTSEEEAPNHYYAGEESQYTVELIASNDIGCKDMISKQIPKINKAAILEMPNVFSPNNDMIQDYFNPVAQQGTGSSTENVPKVNEFKVFNRFGKLIYDNQTPDTGWNGHIDGDAGKDPVSEDVYIYYINYNQGCNGEVVTKKGNVTLIR